jgi:Mce-associated membrane protein
MTSSATKRPFLGGPLRMATLVVAVLAVLAVAGAGWFGVSWYRASHDGSLALGKARDAVLQDAQQATVNLHTRDYRRVQDGLTLWEQSAAGSLRDEVRAHRDAYARAITDSKTYTTARTLDGAVAALDGRSGTALVLVGVDVTSQLDNGDATCERRRIQLEMVRDGAAWKVSKLTPVGVANPVPGACPAAPLQPLTPQPPK